MSQEGVTYADLRFVRSPPEKSSPPREPGGGGGGEGDGELTYENVEGPQLRRGEKRLEEEEAAARRSSSSGRAPRLGPWTWPLALTLMGACLFLLASTIGVGIRYWQVSQQLQQASHDRAAEREILAQKIRAKEHQLEEATGELSSHRLTLQGCEASGNRMQARLQELEQALSGANDSLALLREEKSRSEEELLQARSCQQAGCCPVGWKLFRWKCLWISWDWKSWEDSKKDCERKESQLLILKKPWDAGEMWDAVVRKSGKRSLQSDGAWIGLRKTSRQPLFWVDGSPYEGTKQLPSYYNGYCVKIRDRDLSFGGCSATLQYICEKAASPGLPAQVPSP
nr:B-cell differentiation antigen CD72-like isoform X1 [Pogona vitticeps]